MIFAQHFSVIRIHISTSAGSYYSRKCKPIAELTAEIS